MNVKKIPLISAMFLTACVTINIYFPAAAAEQAADEIIQDIQKAVPEQPQSQMVPQSDLSEWQISVYALVDRLISVVIAPAHAEADLSVDSVDIRRVTASMRTRFVKLNEFYELGVIGINSDGLLAIKAKASLKDRNKVNKLIAAENSDRIKLYKAIAKANGHPEWFEKIKSTFAVRWVSNAQSGWWYQTSSGSWKQK